MARTALNHDEATFFSSNWDVSFVTDRNYAKCCRAEKTNYIVRCFEEFISKKVTTRNKTTTGGNVVVRRLKIKIFTVHLKITCHWCHPVAWRPAEVFSSDNSTEEEDRESNSNRDTDSQNFSTKYLFVTTQIFRNIKNYLYLLNSYSTESLVLVIDNSPLKNLC